MAVVVEIPFFSSDLLDTLVDDFLLTAPRVEGGPGDDPLVGTDADEAFFGFDGDDVINTGDGLNVAFGGDGGDTIIGGTQGDGVDILFGDAGDDVLQGKAGTNVMVGGAGSDLFRLGGESDGIDPCFDQVLDFTFEEDRIELNFLEYFGGFIPLGGVFEGTSGDNIAGGFIPLNGVVGGIAAGGFIPPNGIFETLDGATNGIAPIAGTAGPDQVTISTHIDLAFVANFVDTATAGTGIALDAEDALITLVFGDETDALAPTLLLDLDGGEAEGVQPCFITGTEAMAGMAGDEIMLGDGAGNTFSGSTGNDAMLGFAGDDFIFGEAGNDALFGGFGNDVLDGGAGSNVMDGGAGDDILMGMTGFNAMTGGEGADVFSVATYGRFLSPGGVQRITDLDFSEGDCFEFVEFNRRGTERDRTMIEDEAGLVALVDELDGLRGRDRVTADGDDLVLLLDGNGFIPGGFTTVILEGWGDLA